MESNDPVTIDDIRNMAIVDDDVVIKADDIPRAAEMYAELKAAGMPHDDAVQWGARMLKSKSKKAEL